MGFRIISYYIRVKNHIERALKKKVKLSSQLTQSILKYLEEIAFLQEPDAVTGIICRDPLDLHVLGLAYAAQPSCIVTGDQGSARAEVI